MIPKLGVTPLSGMAFITVPASWSLALLPAAYIGAPPSGTVTAFAIGPGSSVHAPSMSTSPGGSIAITAIGSALTFGTPSVSTIASGSIAPAAIGSSSALFAPILSTNASGSITPGTISSGSSLPAPGVTSGAAGSISPSVMSSTILPSPMLVTSPAGAIVASLIGSVSVVPAPALAGTPVGQAAWRSAYAAAQAGTTQARINMIGDSTMGTSGGVTAGAIAGAYQRAIPAILEQKFQAAGMLYGGEGFYGTGLGSTDITNPSYVSYNSLMSTVGYFTTFSGVTSVGGYLFYGSANNTDPFMQWNPTAPFDRLTVYYVPGASLVVAIDGTVIDSISPGSGSIISKTYNLSLGSHNVRLASQNGQYCFPVGAEAWDSTKQKSVLVRGMPWATSTTGQWNDTSNGYGPIGTLPLLKADMHCIMLGINNWKAGAVTSAYTSDIAAIATAAKSQGGSVMLLGPARSNPATVAPDSQQQAYVDALNAYASAQGYDFMDVKDVLGSFATANAAGDMADDYHQTAQGVGKISQAIYTRLTS